MIQGAGRTHGSLCSFLPLLSSLNKGTSVSLVRSSGVPRGPSPPPVAGESPKREGPSVREERFCTVDKMFVIDRKTSGVNGLCRRETRRENHSLFSGPCAITSPFTDLSHALAIVSFAHPVTLIPPFFVSEIQSNLIIVLESV